MKTRTHLHANPKEELRLGYLIQYLFIILSVISPIVEHDHFWTTVNLQATNSISSNSKHDTTQLLVDILCNSLNNP